MALVGQQGSLAHLRHSGDMIDGAATSSNLARCQARKKRVLGDLISLLNTLWFIALIIHWPELVTWLHLPTKWSESQQTCSHKKRELDIFGRQHSVTTTLNKHPSPFFSLV